MHTGGRWSYVGDYGKLGAGSRSAVDEAVKHASSRWFANRRCHPGDSGVIVASIVVVTGNTIFISFSDIHTLMINEVLMSDNRHDYQT